jgi:hypothetical protein
MRCFVPLLVCATLLCAPSLRAQQDNIFFIGKERPQRVVVTIGDDPPPPEHATAGMFGLLHGVIADLKGQDVGTLLATPMPKSKLLDARGNLERLGVAHLLGKEGTKRVALYWGNEGTFVAEELGVEGGGKAARLDAGRARMLFFETAPWPLFRGEVEPATPPAVPATGASVELEKPYVQAPFFLDQQTLGDRFLRGRPTDIPATTRALAEEQMFVRVPRGYDPRRPAGLLVWVNAGGDGQVPQACGPVLDELGMLGVGIVNVGNDRPLADRYQLALDAVWTVARRFHVDQERVYLSGISGGAAVVSMLGPCFPEYFAGTVPVVGLRSYFNIPVGNGKYIRAGYERPEAKRWAMMKKRRMAPITGDLDGNAQTIRQGAKGMQQDGVPVRVFDIKELGHQMPSATQFAQALRWVDEPRAQARAKAVSDAGEALAKYEQKFGKTPPANAKQREELLRVTEIGPWSDAAWEAVELLRAPSAFKP